MDFSFVIKLWNRIFGRSINVNTDCLLHVIEQVPLQTRLQTMKIVSNQWKEAVERLCASQKELTLQIGSGNQWKRIDWRITTRRLLWFNAVNPFYCLTIVRLTDELTTLLTSTFPNLQTLVVIIDDNTKNANFLLHLPRFISSYSDTLTTLQLVFNVKKTAFQTVFPPLIVSIDGLHKLQRLSFFDSSYRLKIPPFDLPHLIRTSLDSLDFYSYHSPDDFALHWEASLEARIKPNLLTINYFAYGRKWPATPFSLSAKAAAHFNCMIASMKSSKDVKRFTTNFISLKALVVFYSRTLPMRSVLNQLAKLQHLTHLELVVETVRRIVHNPNQPIPVLPAISKLIIHLNSKSVHHAFLNEALQGFSEIFPNLKQVEVKLFSKHCIFCQWRVKVYDNGCGCEGKIEGSADQLKQCVRLLAAPFVKTKPKMSVNLFKQHKHNLCLLVTFVDLFNWL